MSNINMILQKAIDILASDVHLIVDKPPVYRVNGKLSPETSANPLSGNEIKELIMSILNPEQKDLFLTNREIDFSYNLQGGGRFRVNAYYQQGSMAAAFRHIPINIKSFEQLNLPSAL